MKTYSGSWSDRINKRKPFIVAGYALGALSKPLIGISASWVGVLFARGIDRTGKGLRSSPRDALIADSVSAEDRGTAFGWHRGMDTLGAAVGPLFALLLLSLSPGDLRALYFWALIPGAISVAIIFSVQEKPRAAADGGWKNPFSAWKETSPRFKRYVLAWGIFSLANSSDAFLLMKAKVSGLSTSAVILLFCAYNLTYAFSSPKLGQLSDRVDKRYLLIAGLLVFAAVYFGFGVAQRPWHFWALFLFYGIYMGATDGVGKALAVDLSPAELKGTSLGILGTVTGICTIVASSMAGVLWDRAGTMWPFFYGVLGALIAAAMLAWAPKGKGV
jgi:MFS family permease